MIRVHVWYEFSSLSSLFLRLRRASSTFPWLRRLRALPSGPTALTTGRRDRTGIFVFIWCDVRLKWRKRKSDIISCLKEHKVLLCWTAITQTPVLLLHEDPSLLVATHRFHTDPHYTNTQPFRLAQHTSQHPTAVNLSADLHITE